MGYCKRAFALKTLIYGVIITAAAIIVHSGVAQAAAISQGFSSKAILTPGAIVSNDPNAKNGVVYANINNADQLIGVVVATKAATIAVSGGTNETQVATSGIVNVIVTNRDGAIQTGDQIAPSNIEGIGSKASADGRIVGVAQADFDGSGPNVDKRTVGGKSVSIGTIPVLLSASTYVLPTNSALDSLVPKAIKNAAQRVAGGHAVSSLKILLSLAALIMGIVSSTFIMYGAIRAGIISIGRNPLSGTEIRRNLIQVVGAGLTILTLSVLVSYFTIIW